MAQSNLILHQAGNRIQPQPQRTFDRTPEAAPASPARPRLHEPLPPRAEIAGRMRPPAATGRSQARNGGSVRLSGRIGRYFDLKRTRSGRLLAVFSMATVEPCRDPSGSWATKTVWQRIVVWGEAAQAVGEQLRKGARVEAEGRFKTWEWTDSDNRLHTTTELVAREVYFPETAKNRVAA